MLGRLGCAVASLRGPPKTELEKLLDSVTRAADSIDVNQNALESVVRACADEADRRAIMRHLSQSLMESGSSQWRSVYLGLQVLEELFARGPPELVHEAATGAHFDVVQRLSFLEKYEMGIDLRVQNLVRRKAATMKASWMKRQVEEELGVDAPAVPQRTQSAGTKTPGARSTKSYKTATSVMSVDTDSSGGEGGKHRYSSDPRVNVRRRGADEDTDDEEPPSRPSPSAKSGNAGGGYSSDPRVAGMMRRPGDDSTDDEDDRPKRPAMPPAEPAKPPPPPSSATVDLMGLMDDPAPAPPARPAPPADSFDLLGGGGGGGSAPTGGASSSDSKFPPAPAAGQQDWLAMAQNHGLYATGKPGAGDLPPAPQAAKEASLLDF
jgi:hypothetical protein